MILGVSYNQPEDLPNYTAWVGRRVPGIHWIRLSHADDNPEDLDRCSGLILTGGGDVHPRYYGKPEEVSLARGVSEERDRFEFALIERALSKDLPILGICRGMQVFNVALHGSLFTDLQIAGHQDHGKIKPGVDRSHSVIVVPDSALHGIVARGAGEVNSSHHQAVDLPGDGLQIAARSPDGVTEAAGWIDRKRHPFLLLVQWHPERMANRDSAFSNGILRGFIDAVQQRTN